jgi:hypothetical protein
VTNSSHDPIPSYLNCFQDSSPMFRSENQHWSMRTPDKNIFNMDTSSQSLFLRSPNIFASRPLPPLPRSSIPSSVPPNGLIGGSDFDSDRASPSTVYSTYSGGGGSLTSDSMAGSFNSLAVQDDAISAWWPEVARSTGLGQLDTIMPLSFDGFPGSWDENSNALLQFTQQSAPPGTISPKELTLNVCAFSIGSSALSTIGSSRSMATSASSVLGDPSTPAASIQVGEIANISDPGNQNPDTRRKLPSHPLSNANVPILASNDRGTAKGDKKRSHASRGSNSTREERRPENRRSSKNATTTAKPTPKRLEPKPEQKSLPPDTPAISVKIETTTSINRTKINQITRRESKDEFLVKSKLAGMSYRDIRRQGGFTEAESTLRGRFRTLTKDKAERVRRPTWDENDVGETPF